MHVLQYIYLYICVCVCVCIINVSLKIIYNILKCRLNHYGRVKLPISYVTIFYYYFINNVGTSRISSL